MKTVKANKDNDLKLRSQLGLDDEKEEQPMTESKEENKLEYFTEQGSFL